jgi:alkylhydroperoxidase/carboxymuconolactone decarboxylase family protein YurZ
MESTVSGSADLPHTYRSFIARHPDLKDALEAMGRAVDEAGPLDRKTAELVKLGVCAGAGLESATRSHARRALEAGATAGEVEHAVLQGMNTVGWSRTIMAWQWALEALDDVTER